MQHLLDSYLDDGEEGIRPSSPSYLLPIRPSGNTLDSDDSGPGSTSGRDARDARELDIL